jgi:hypothetical protein
MRTIPARNGGRPLFACLTKYLSYKLRANDAALDARSRSPVSSMASRMRMRHMLPVSSSRGFPCRRLPPRAVGERIPARTPAQCGEGRHDVPSRRRLLAGSMRPMRVGRCHSALPASARPALLGACTVAEDPCARKVRENFPRDGPSVHRAETRALRVSLSSLRAPGTPASRMPQGSPQGRAGTDRRSS